MGEVVPSQHPAVVLRLRSNALRALFAVAAAGLVALASWPAAAPAANQYRVEVSNLRSGLRADVMWASQQPGQGVFLWRNNRSASQEFDLLDSGNGFFRIRARHSKQCLILEWRQGRYTNGTPIVQHPDCRKGYAPGEWRRGWAGFAPECDGDICSTIGTEYPVLVNRKTGKCLDARNPTTKAPRVQAVLQQWRCIRYADDWNAGNQLWRFGNEHYL